MARKIKSKITLNLLPNDRKSDGSLLILQVGVDTCRARLVHKFMGRFPCMTSSNLYKYTKRFLSTKDNFCQQNSRRVTSLLENNS